MAVEVRVPSFGESIKEGVIVRWLKSAGDYVQKDEDLVEIETDKATNPLPSPAAGTLSITVPEGKKILIDAVIGAIDEKAPAPAKAPTGTVRAKPESAPAAAKPAPPPKPSAQAPPMSPAARVLVAEKGLDPKTIAPSGRGGVIVKDDVLAQDGRLAAPPAAEPAPAARISRQKMSPIRQRIADRLMASQQGTATLTTFNEADMSAIMDLRTRFKESFQKKHGVNLGFMSFFLKAAVEALKAFPIVNARIEGDEIVFQNFWNVSVAVATEKGLFVPVLRDCDRLSFADIEKGIADLAMRARDARIRPEDLADGTFTITNGGIYGSMMSTPILNPPQSAILGMHAINKRPVVKDDQIVIRPMMYLALSYDHRLIDGREAVLFLSRIKETIENPGRLLLDI